MPTIKDKLHFNFDGIWSHAYKLIHIVLDSGMYEETFVAERNIVETNINGSDKPLLHRVETSPLEFDMTIAFEEGFSDNTINQIIQWLFQDDYYRPLYFEGKEDRVYYCMPVGEPSIIHNGLSQGYFNITMRCNSSRIYSPVNITQNETITTNKTITIVNDGHYDIFPEISIVKNGAGHIVIESLDDNNDIFEIRDLTNMEDLYLNCEKEIIETDLTGVTRYNKLNGEFPRILIGTNRFKITGACTIQFRYKKNYKF